MSLIGTESSGELIKSGIGRVLLIPDHCPDCLTAHSLQFNSYIEVECIKCHSIIE